MSKEAHSVIKILKTDNTSFEEDRNQLDMLSLMSQIKGLPTLS